MFLIEVYIKETKDKGLGVFAKKDIKKDTLIWEFIDGFDIKVHESKINYLNDVQKKFIDTYFWKEGEYYLSSCDHSIFQNHSSNPNSIPVGLNKMYASRDIKANEEILTNYSQFDDEYENYKNKLID